MLSVVVAPNLTVSGDRASDGQTTGDTSSARRRGQPQAPCPVLGRSSYKHAAAVHLRALSGATYTRYTCTARLSETSFHLIAFSFQLWHCIAF